MNQVTEILYKVSWLNNIEVYLIPLLVLKIIQLHHRTGGVMVSVLASSAVDRGFEPRWIKPKPIKLVFVGSPLST